MRLLAVAILLFASLAHASGKGPRCPELAELGERTARAVTADEWPAILAAARKDPARGFAEILKLFRVDIANARQRSGGTEEAELALWNAVQSGRGDTNFYAYALGAMRRAARAEAFAGDPLPNDLRYHSKLAKDALALARDLLGEPSLDDRSLALLTRLSVGAVRKVRFLGDRQTFEDYMKIEGPAERAPTPEGERRELADALAQLFPEERALVEKYYLGEKAPVTLGDAGNAQLAAVVTKLRRIMTGEIAPVVVAKMAANVAAPTAEEARALFLRYRALGATPETAPELAREYLGRALASGDSLTNLLFHFSAHENPLFAEVPLAHRELYGFRRQMDSLARSMREDALAAVRKKLPRHEHEQLAAVQALRAVGITFRAIATFFNENGVPVRSGKGKWHHGVVMDMMSAPAIAERTGVRQRRYPWRPSRETVDESAARAAWIATAPQHRRTLLASLTVGWRYHGFTTREIRERFRALGIVDSKGKPFNQSTFLRVAAESQRLAMQHAIEAFRQRPNKIIEVLDYASVPPEEVAQFLTLIRVRPPEGAERWELPHVIAVLETRR